MMAAWSWMTTGSLLRENKRNKNECKQKRGRKADRQREAKREKQIEKRKSMHQPFEADGETKDGAAILDPKRGLSSLSPEEHQKTDR